MIKNTLIGFLLASSFVTQANATPLSLSYDISTISNNTYLYQFKLVNDNHDNSWSIGQDFDWITFGDAQIGQISPLTDFVGDLNSLVGGPYQSNGFTFSSGGHNGPTLLGAFPYNGWQPSSIGDYITWSGTSKTFLGQGQLLWSNLLGNGVSANFETATLNVSSVPEPQNVSLMTAGLILLGLRARKKQA